jgi:hypothetical protein
MLERNIYCGGLKADRNDASVLHLDVNALPGSPSRVNLAISDISRRLADNIPDVLVDMLEIASYVYCADQFTRRGTPQMRNMGAEWRRQFRFKIPVRRPEIWGSAHVREALTETLEFLSEDGFAFEFVRAKSSLPLQAYLPFNDLKKSSCFQAVWIPWQVPSKQGSALTRQWPWSAIVDRR